jgi:hypothetical protein
MAKARLWAPRRSRRLSKGIPLCCAPCRSPDNLPSDFLGARGVAIGHKAAAEFCNVVRNCLACVAVHLRCRWRQSLRSVRPSRTRQGRCPTSTHWQTPFQWAAPSIIKFVSLKPTARCSRSNVSDGRTKRAEKESGSHGEEIGRPAETAPKETNRVTC